MLDQLNEPIVASAVASIPTVDLATATAEEFTDQLIAGSCVFVVGHGIDQRLRSEMNRVSREFFSLPSEVKSQVRWPGTGVWHGWMPDGGATDLAPTATPDLVEWYQVNEVDDFSLWPDEPAEMRIVWSDYYRACRSLASRLVSMIASALELPLEDLPAWTDEQFANLAVNHYPPLRVPPRAGQVRLSTHTDECGLTILTANDAPGGLEVRIPGTGVWTPVQFPENSYLIQAGDLLARWTNRVVRANVHRVVNPPLELIGDAGTERNTLVFFHLPSLDTQVVPAPSCVARTGGHALPALDAFEFVISRQKTYVADVPINVDVEV
jgi:isopenicillin N synthase-like dioxygenase